MVNRPYSVFRGTKVVRNGHEGEADVHFGWAVKLVAAALIGLASVAVQRAFVISAKIEVIESRQLTVMELVQEQDTRLHDIERTAFTKEEFDRLLSLGYLSPGSTPSTH